MPRMRRFVKENSLCLFFLVIFAAAIAAQAIAGHNLYNEQQLAHDGETISLGRYVTSSEFGQAVMENWQSEYLQFTLLLVTTIWLLQRGSPESKELAKAGLESDEDQLVGEHARSRSPLWARAGGLRTAIYSNSLLILMAAIWIGTWVAQSVTGWSSFNADQIEHHESTVSWFQYLGTSEFWETTLQNWQSEFLAVGSFAAFTIYLRQRGSPHSKPVGAPHDATSVEG
jgi:hypothetical protein